MKTIAAELGGSGIRVNAILPGMVDGERINAVIAAKADAEGIPPEEITRRAMAGISIKRLVDPQDLAALALFLASDAARPISGQAISADNDLQFMV
jgi:NAD(P)-dependent dehydrogenase (short-subunit alcohol dehydrogenase family)